MDKDFTSKAMSDKRDYELFEKIIEMVHSIGIKICIEGIERGEWQLAMKRMKADYLQGCLLYTSRTGNNAGVFGRIAFLIFILLFGIATARQTVASLKKVRRAEELEQFALNDSMTGIYLSLIHI